ncbi:MAG: Threonylcarbamoyladenosine tRNA methylthiotransferase MtaB [Alphaproteobacteria bacterium MarineAlpha5_Bin5]|nr:MAG: Threonylcarbamoyladenosine tRNA methylthiotransferase MtaB [Alphaproteobacteria bacterium MarineAlpha5_Bin5]PPR52519.1 MAG: Threonylcarbamoyladenosine tRNA methylthiotransferase MtaB [Alphaproteobacteria bacterium MarineAlpha5_Bin4]|tara:strand:+ start:46 stop:1305 length:1260 start_codon:yes stop_codon:yes gene_type:complete
MSKKTNIVNLGCRLNLYEGEIIKNHAINHQLKNVTIINSCAVTEEAEKKVAYEIRKAKKNKPKNKIVLTGCAAQINPKKYKLFKEVDLIVGNKEKLLSQTWKDIDYSKTLQLSNILEETSVVPASVDKFEGKSRAFIEIQQGCNHRCTFCIIPYGRGNNRSVPAGDIVNRIQNIVNNGYKEVVLTGVDITDYGKNLPGRPSFSNLIERILKLVPGLKRLRLSSIDCAEITDDFWHLLSEERLMPHFHLSLQAGNNLILKRMKRRHTREQAIEFCNKVLSMKKDATFGADIIAGFPTETDKMFDDSIRLIKECHLTHVHVFPYSSREKTAAAHMPQVEKNIIKKRAKELRKKGAEQMNKHLLNIIGNKDEILIEQTNETISKGKGQNFINVKLNEKIDVGKIVRCIYTGIKDDILLAKRI